MYDVVVSVHVVAAVAGFGATFTYPFIARAGDYATILAISRGLAVPAALVVGATGVYQVADGPYGLGETWLAAGTALYVLVMLVATLVVAPAYARVAETPPASEAHRAAQRRIAVLGPALAAAIVAIVVLMETKPQ